MDQIEKRYNSNPMNSPSYVEYNLVLEALMKQLRNFSIKDKQDQQSAIINNHINLNQIQEEKNCLIMHENKRKTMDENLNLIIKKRQAPLRGSAWKHENPLVEMSSLGNLE